MIKLFAFLMNFKGVLQRIFYAPLQCLDIARSPSNIACMSALDIPRDWGLPRQEGAGQYRGAYQGGLRLEAHWTPALTYSRAEGCHAGQGQVNCLW